MARGWPFWLVVGRCRVTIFFFLIFFFRISVVEKGGVRTPWTPPLDPPLSYGTDATLLYYRLGLLIRTSTLHGETGPCESHFIKETFVYLCRQTACIRACIATYSVGWEAGSIPHAVLLVSYQCMHVVANKAYAWLYY